VTRLRHHTEPDALVLTPDGHIDTRDVHALLAAVARLLDDEPRGRVVLDLSLVRTPGLATIDALMRLHLSTRRRGRPMLIRHTPAMLEQALAMTGLSDTLPPRDACNCRVCGER
jgi:anti-anti-sigma factor